MYCFWVLILYFSGCQNTFPFTLPKIHKSMSCYLSETCIAVEFIYNIFQVVRIHFRSPCLRYTNLWVVTCLRCVLLLSLYIIFFRLSEYTSVHPAYDTQIYELLPVWDMYWCWVLILYFSGCQNTLPFTLPTIHKSMSRYLS